MESKLQRKISKALELKGWIVVKIMKASYAGWPDLQIHKQGITAFIEVKDKGKKAKPIQQYVHRKLDAQGFDVYVIDSWEQYLDMNL